MRRALFSIILLCLVCAGCARVNHIAEQARSYVPLERVVTNNDEQIAQLQRQLDEAQARVEQRAVNKEIAWLQAAREVRNLHRRSSPTFDRIDEEYHSYSASLAEQVDAGRLTRTRYDALRVQRLYEIQRRRARQ